MKKILLIDDDQDISELMKIVLEGQYEVETHASHADVCNKIQNFNPDLIILDNWIGQTQAADMIGDIKTASEYNPVPIVLFSAHADIKQIAEEIDADAYLAKPFNLTDLYNCIDRQLGIKQAS